MGNTDSTPGVSQAKAFVQLCSGDFDGAARTTENFFRECPGVSQCTSLVQLAKGDADGALETQKRCGKGVLNAMDGVPVVGHVKGVVHYALGDEKGGDRAMKSASRTTCVMAAGAVGMVGGPGCAIAMGASVGTLFDSTASIIEHKPTGIIAGIQNVIENPSAGAVFDVALIPVSDGLAGYNGGNVAKSIQNKVNVIKGRNLEAKAMSMLETIEDGKASMTSGEYMTQSNNVMTMINKANKKKGKTSVFVDPKNPNTSTAQAVSSQTKNVPATVFDGQHVIEKAEKYATKIIYKVKQGVKQVSMEDVIVVCKCGAAVIIGREFKQRVNQICRQCEEETKRKKKEKCICIETKEKFAAIKAWIDKYEPHIIAFVETWLNDNHRVEDVIKCFELNGYTIARHDRGSDNVDNAYSELLDGIVHNPDKGHRGGGILVAHRFPPSLRILFIRYRDEDLRDNVVNFMLKITYWCKKCQRQPDGLFGFTVAYRRPGPFNTETWAEFKKFNDQMIKRIEHLSNHYTTYVFDGHVFVGDFNLKAFDWLKNITLSEDVDISLEPTHVDGNPLDQVFGHPFNFVDNIMVTEPISDHCALLFELNLGKDFPDGRCCDQCQKY